LRFAGEGSGLVSDDTQMTLFTAEGLIRARRAGAADPVPFVLGAYQRWYGTQAMRQGRAASAPSGQGLLLAEPRLHARRAPGGTCLSALAQSFMDRPLRTVENPPNYSKGCGAVMRSAPFGLAASTRSDAFRHARDAAVLTHGHPSGYLSAAYLAALIFDLARGSSIEQAMAHADAELDREVEAEELRAALRAAKELGTRGPPTEEIIERLGSGWTGEEALAIALLCASTATGAAPEDTSAALWRAVSHGGDSDSTGSITGNLLGAMHGIECFSSRWREQLEMNDLIARVASDLWTVCVEGGSVLDGAYPAHR
jgi:ADP-ribosylglycohydrolase